MPVLGIVRGQKVSDDKLELARELRRRMTAEERILWRELRGQRLQGLRFRRQQVIDGYIADFYCHAACLVVEVDGEVHAAQKDYDAERDRALSERGLRILRVTNEDVRCDLPSVLARIAHKARSAGPDPVAPLGDTAPQSGPDSPGEGER